MYKAGGSAAKPLRLSFLTVRKTNAQGKAIRSQWKHPVALAFATPLFSYKLNSSRWRYAFHFL
jgi:hypothetical protein